MSTMIKLGKPTGKNLLEKSLAGFNRILADLNKAIDLDDELMEAKEASIQKLEAEVEELHENRQRAIGFRDRLSQLIGS